MEMVRLQHLLDTIIEALDHAVGLWVRGSGPAVFDVEISAELIELVLACCGAFAQT